MNSKDEKMKNKIYELIKKKFFEATGTKLYHIKQLAQIDDMKEWRLGVKIVITDIYEEEQRGRKKLRTIISPIMNTVFPSQMRKLGEFGLFHVAIIIGPWYLEWSTSEIVVPKLRFASRKALVCFDIPNLTYIKFKEFKKMVKKLVNVIYKWNTKYCYQDIYEKDKGGNCQHFIEELLIELGIKLDQLGPLLSNFIKNLSKRGKSSLLFTPSKRFKKALNLKWKEKSFDNHFELDKFVRSIMIKLTEIGNNLQINFPDEYIFFLLKKK